MLRSIRIAPPLALVSVIVGFLSSTLPATSARANPESPAVYDARVMGMGGAVGPIITGPSAIYHGVPVRSPVASSTDFAQPDMLRFGVATRLLEQRLTISTEVRVQFHKAVNQSQDFTVQFPIGSQTIPITVTQPMDWRNAIVFTLGGEYVLDSGFALRMGFSTGRGATPKHTLTAYTPLPSGQVGIFLGAGYHHERFDLDFAAGYGGGRAIHVTEEYPTCTNPGMNSAVGCPGRYEIDTIFLSVSTRVRL